MRRFLSIAILLFLGACMNPLQVQSMHQVLNDPPRFQKEFGDHPQAIGNFTFPDSLWKDLTLKGWSFQQTIFQGTRFENVVFEDAVFDRCEFRAADIKKATFKNCRFGNILMRGGHWEDNVFQGGEMFGFDSENEIGYRRSGRWLRNTFEKFHLHDNHPGIDAAEWEQCTFRDAKIENNNFGEPWDDFRQDLEGWSTTISDATFERCTFKGNNWRHALQTGVIRDCQMDGDDFSGISGTIVNSKFKVLRGTAVDGDIRDCEFVSMGEGDAFGITGGKNVTAKGYKEGYGIENSENISVDGAVEGMVDVTGSNKHLTIRNISVKNFTLSGKLEQSTFENFKVNSFGYQGLHCTGCTFKDIEITEDVPIWSAPEDAATFTDCKFINMRRAPGVFVYEFLNEPIPNFTLPWESAPGVPKDSK